MKVPKVLHDLWDAWSPQPLPPPPPPPPDYLPDDWRAMDGARVPSSYAINDLIDRWRLRAKEPPQ